MSKSAACSIAHQIFPKGFKSGGWGRWSSKPYLFRSRNYRFSLAVSTDALYENERLPATLEFHSGSHY